MVSKIVSKFWITNTGPKKPGLQRQTRSKILNEDEIIRVDAVIDLRQLDATFPEE